MKSTLYAIAIATFLNAVLSHSIMTYPKPITHLSCREGGDPALGNVKDCKGPCKIRRFTEGKFAEQPYTDVYPPNNPVKEVFRRGQKVTVKYTRNNHGPGGFNRFTLVRYTNQTGPETAKDYMDKAIHSRNAFHYSCWGARPVVATEAEKKEEFEYGLTWIGSDSQEHDQPAGYYISDITIPPVVPDGLYILGWVWFGGTSGAITTNAPQVPKKYSYFSDYWGCSFIKIEGGVPLAAEYTPVFDNDYSFDKNAEGAEGMEKGCMAQNDRPGICPSEPCRNVDSFYRKPAVFKDGPPKPLTPANFGGEIIIDQEAPLPSPSSLPRPPFPSPAKEEEIVKPPVTPSPIKEEVTKTSSPFPFVELDILAPSVSPSASHMKEENIYTYLTPSPMLEKASMEPSPGMTEVAEVSFTDRNKAFRTCSCIYYGTRCGLNYAATTYGCKGNTFRGEQPYECKKVCCNLCTSSHFFCEYMRKNHCSRK